MINPKNKRIFVIFSLSFLVYILSVLIEKRINPENPFTFNLWDPLYVLLAIFIPGLLLLSIKLFPTSSYAKYFKTKEKILSKIVLISTGFLTIWLVIWYGMIGFGNIIDNRMGWAEAEQTANTYIHGENYLNNNNPVDSIVEISNSISSEKASFNYKVYCDDTIIDAELLLIRKEKWNIDTLIIK